jgi:Sulfotransferase domain
MLTVEQAVLDVPAILFVEELIAAYPDAKVILTERPVEGELEALKSIRRGLTAS